ncbi:MAG: hypothetical protein ACRD19_05795 [Terriglobia bacterium]
MSSNTAHSGTLPKLFTGYADVKGIKPYHGTSIPTGTNDTIKIGCITSWIPKLNRADLCAHLHLQKDGHWIAEGAAIQIELCCSASVHTHKE